MNNVADNQILITRSEDRKIITVQVGSNAPVAFSSCPNRPYDNIQNAINTYFDSLKEQGIKEECWSNKGCWYTGTGSCRDCN